MRLLARFALLVCAAVPLFARDLPPIDEFATGAIHADAQASVAGRARSLAANSASIPVEPRLRVPTFVWAQRPEQALSAVANDAAKGTPRKGKKEEAAARAHLGRNASLYQLDLADIDAASAVMTHNTGRGPVIVKLRQQVRGIEIFREEINIVMNRGLELVGIGGYISSASTPDVRGKDLAFELNDRAAALAAVSDLTGITFRNNDLKNTPARDGYDYFTLDASSGIQLEEPIRLKKVFFHLQNGLEAAYYVEVAARDVATLTTDYYAYVISAGDGRVMFRNTLGADAGTAYTYRVWADALGYPSDTPAGNAAHPKVNAAPDGYQAPLVAQTDITVANYPFSMNDPWLPPGATETIGNNVDAYSDVTSPDGYNPAVPATPPTGDFRAKTTGFNAFQHTYDMLDPLHHVQRQAATTQLFVDINFLHDWFYDAGFNEASGNAQYDNFGRGGASLDRIKAEAQDSGGSNNANMYTPADGVSPRMQMYMFTLYGGSMFFDVVSPAAAAGKRSIGTASFGPQTFDITAPMIFPAPLTACTTLTNAAQVAGKIVIVDREPTSGEGACAIATKLTNISAAGAAGIILVNLSSWPYYVLYLSDPMPGFATPVLSISWNDAASIRAQLNASNPVVGHMVREPYSLAPRDAAIDNQIVAHEWGHYLSNRLIGNAGGLTNNQGRSMGEGWGDFLALMLTVRPDDVATASNTTWNGTYATGTFATSGGADGGLNQGYYFAIRRYPYSTDLTKNPLTFKHIQNGVALPAGVPVNNNGYGNPNAEVHNSGEMWANVLWECYASLLRDTQGGTPRLTFQQAQDRMKEYIVASLKLTPVTPTYIEGRDALLAAAAANDPVDYTLFYQAFARRGMGVGAIAPDRFSSTHAGVQESFSALGFARFAGSTLYDYEPVTCDADGILDHGETGKLSVSLKNTGTVVLNGITGTITTTTPGITLSGGGAVTFPDVAPGDTTTGIVEVTMAAGVTAITDMDFTLQFSHPSIEAGAQTALMRYRGNADVIPSMLATDTVDTPATRWTASTGIGGPLSPWVRRSVPATVWHVPNPGTAADERLESPPVTISAAGTLKIEFDHLYQFEYYCCGQGWDGGVVEMSRNGGPWNDIGGSAYTGYIIDEEDGGNPLELRPAFVGSAGPLHTVLTPTVAAGDVVRVRFRMGSDYIIGAYGWDIDSITFTGIVETPFDGLVADAGCPTKTTTTRLTSNANPLKLGSTLNLVATVLVPGTPTGTMTFYDGATNLGTVAILDRVATLSSSSFTAGTHLLTAQYSGAAGFTPSTSPTLAQVIDDCSVAPVISSVSAPSSIPAGGTATLSVTATGGVLYEWFNGTAPNVSNPVGTGATLNVIPPASPTLYWVRVSNACGSVNSSSVPVSLVVPAKFYTLTPCRVYDSRNGGSPLQGGQSRYVEAYWCGVPYGARAVAVNVTAVSPPAGGWLTLFPAVTSIVPATSTLNYQIGKTRANNAIVAVGSYGSMYVNNGGSQPVHFIIDVSGYFY